MAIEQKRFHLFINDDQCADEDHRKQGWQSQRQHLQHWHPTNNYRCANWRNDVELALTYPEYRDNALKGQSGGSHFPAIQWQGYQDVQNRVPKIENTMEDLGWKPQFSMKEAPCAIFSTRIARRLLKHAACGITA